MDLKTETRDEYVKLGARSVPVKSESVRGRFIDRSFPGAGGLSGRRPDSHREVLGLGVVEHDRRGQLFGVELEALAQAEADALGAQ